MPEKNFENKVYVFWHTIKMNFLSKIWYFSAAAGDGHAAKDGGENRMNRNGETIKL